MNTSELLGLLARTLAGLDAEASVASRMCRACTTILGARGGSLTLATLPGEQVTVTSTNASAARVESIQEVLGEGPGRRAFDDDRIVSAPLGATLGDDPFPLFSQLAGEAAGSGVWFGVPMRVGGQPVGVLGLVVGPGHELTRDAEEAQFLADAIGTAVLGEIDRLGWTARARVDQATGMVSAQLRVQPTDALAVLRAHAFGRGSTLEEVAEDVVARRLSFADDAGAVETRRSEEG
ncbi:GAF and ANTAR domain-containing protein [Krasilnikoviella flava]|uniref:GAF domain-containing protein n=1 Tax=Krasilnikoviella flava TaxID=526729 RepID=A0A1T5IQJ7_9MICO|nr:GAF and ANTAR domain-containing protein [Krasilnikoviella flava]SKC41362.1 GAF domain-containing protein [Krasilnikoviella flava]